MHSRYRVSLADEQELVPTASMPEQRLEKGRLGATVAARETRDAILGIERSGRFTSIGRHRVTAYIHYHLSASRPQHAMLHDERRRILIVSQASRSRSMNHADRSVAMNLKMQMRMVEPVSVPNQTDLLASSNRLPLGHKDFVQVRVQRIGVLELAAFVEGMTNHNDVAPRTFEISGQANYTVSDRRNRRSVDRSRPGRAHPIFAQVTANTKPARFLVSVRVRSPNRKVEPIRN